MPEDRSDLPTVMDGAIRPAYHWLAANGVTEWLPERPRIDISNGTIRYTAYVWNDDAERGFNARWLLVGDSISAERAKQIIAKGRLKLGDPVIEVRTVPLRVPLTDDARAAFARGGATLTVK
ncbi:hypothetical protein ABT369_38870 [Dactylosporangium sp. NPDC000244]|uniref:hypothetical protein n=1 Tax=Dactylosporangium sp. NPDC000244 TaxID=3154365 RepID=UPI00331BC9A2